MMYVREIFSLPINLKCYLVQRTQNGPLSYANGEAMPLGSQMVSTCNLRSGEALGDAAIPTGKLANGNKKRSGDDE